MIYFLKRLFFDEEQLALIEYLKTKPKGVIKVSGKGSISLNQDYLINSDNYKKAIKDASKLIKR